MLNLDKLPDQVHWTEGMFLSPQHFQQSTVYLENLLAHQLQRVSPFYWGIISCQIDELSLAHEKLLVTEIQGVMPDGTLIQYLPKPNDDQDNQIAEKELSLDLGDLKIESKNSFLVYLALPKISGGCAGDEDKDLKRYQSINAGLTPDQNDINNRVDVVRLRPVLRLVDESSLSPNYTAFPIVRLTVSTDGSFVSSPYTPPLITIAGKISSELTLLNRKIGSSLGRVRTRANQLRNFLDDDRTSGLTVEAEKQRINYLVSRLPRAEVLLDADSHPFEIYQALVELAASLAPLNEDPVCPRWARYNHNDLDAVFLPVLAFINETLEKVRLHFLTLPFAARGEGEFILEFPPETNVSEVMIGFEVSPGISSTKLEEWIDSSYICKESDYEFYEVRRDLGARRVSTKEFTNINLAAGSNELFYSVDLSVNGGEKIIISGSDEKLNEFRPKLVNCFLENK